MADPKLYIIGTPLGNRNDITLRALDALRSLEVFFAEDTRELAKLLELHGISPAEKTLHSYGNHNMRSANSLALEMLRDGKAIGFVSDRGTPGISDPGPLLAQAARGQGIDVIPVPGPSSVTTAFSVAGVSGDRFLFLGFLSTTKGEREQSYELIQKTAIPACFFESPRRVGDTIAELRAAFPSGRLFIGREMTKLHETYLWIDLSSEPPAIVEKGEFVLILDPGPRRAEEVPDWEEQVRLRLAPDKEWAKSVAAQSGVTASQVYNALQKLKNSRGPAE